LGGTPPIVWEAENAKRFAMVYMVLVLSG